MIMVPGVLVDHLSYIGMTRVASNLIRVKLSTTPVVESREREITRKMLRGACGKRREGRSVCVKGQTDVEEEIPGRAEGSGQPT